MEDSIQRTGPRSLEGGVAQSESRMMYMKITFERRCGACNAIAFAIMDTSTRGMGVG